MNMLSRVNLASCCFVYTLIGVLALFLNDHLDPVWVNALRLATLAVCSFGFIRFSLLFIREGEPEADKLSSRPGAGSGAPGEQQQGSQTEKENTVANTEANNWR